MFYVQLVFVFFFLLARNTMEQQLCMIYFEANDFWSVLHTRQGSWFSFDCLGYPTP